MNDKKLIGQLYRLAHLYSVQTAFYGVGHRRITAPAESLLAVLQALGAPVLSLNDVASAWRERTLAIWKRITDPVTVAWNGERPVINFTLPSEIADKACFTRLELESGETSEFRWQAGDLPVVQSLEVEGKCYFVKKYTLPDNLPYGYHKFIFKIKGKSWNTMIISAPPKIYGSVKDNNDRIWGAFLPLYALKTEYDWGSGDYTGLGQMVDWVVDKGGNSLGTLPLLPVFLDEPYDHSPYAPVSRMLWNEFYVDINNSPELLRCPEAQSLVQSPPFMSETKSLREQALVDYRRTMSLKRRVMEEIIRHQPDWAPERLVEFRKYAHDNPVVVDYARFRAAVEKQHATWRSWSQRLRGGLLRESDYEEGVRDYYVYAQWLARQQVQEVAEKSRRKGVQLYFDLPIGVHPDGYDVWCHQDIFVSGVSAGAPPDQIFTTGQDWGFPPLHPEKIRVQGYSYIREYLSHHLRNAALLRIDHVMGLHRLYWIPRGFQATQGVYVRYRPEELYAILAVESHRHRSIIVGEDLGIVPGYVRPTMARHGLHRMYVAYYELADNTTQTPRRIPHNCIASLNTHDMPPFAAFWEGMDIRENIRLGLLSEKDGEIEKEKRRITKAALISFLLNRGFLEKAGDSTRAALKAYLAFLSDSRAQTVMINVEDLWLEDQSQNVPATGDLFPNWQRKARYKLEEFCCMSEIDDILRVVTEMRKPVKKQVQLNKESGQ